MNSPSLRDPRVDPPLFPRAEGLPPAHDLGIELTPTELQAVAGGINPQPLPPCSRS